MMSHQILVVEDESVTRARLCGYFEKAGYRVLEAEDAAAMRKHLSTHDVDLVMLDINLPDDDGLALTRELRGQSEIGIILVTARTDSIDRIVGLEMGADDYVTKPFEFRELLVRVRNLLWRVDLLKQVRAQLPAPDVHDGDVTCFGDWRFDIPRRQLCCKGEPVRLTKAEYDVLVAFIAQAGRVLSRDRLLAMISHRVDAPGDRTIDVLVRRLRNKMEVNPRAPQLFVTVHGEGYLFAGELTS